MSKKKYQYRIRKMAIGVYVVEEMHRILFFKKYWIRGSRRFKLKDEYESAEKARKDIMAAAEAAGVEVQVTDLEAEFIRIKSLVKGQVKQARKRARKMDEKARNLRRIRKDDE